MADMEKLGREMMKKCGGLPLAIEVLGGVLAAKYSLCGWEEVHKNVKLYLRISKGNEQENSDCFKVLALSYNELPYYLKSCFLHLGNFPEDDDGTMEDVAQRYLNDLVDRSIVQVSQIGSMGRVKTCRLHDLMREFCLSRAYQENYLHIMSTTSLNDTTKSNRIHRLVVHPDNNKDIDLGYYARRPCLRSFLLFMSHTLSVTMIKSSFTDFKLLKIMSLENCRIEKNMGKEIGGLVHLSYLAFENCKIEALPTSIRGQTMIVPDIFQKLKQLRHLILVKCRVEGGELLKLGNMRELKTCSQIYIDDDPTVLFDVAELVNFSHLEILALVLNEDSNESLSGLSSLSIINRKNKQVAEEEFTLSSCSELKYLSYNGRIRNKLPACQHFPPNLTKLTLQSCYLMDDPMPIL